MVQQTTHRIRPGMLIAGMGGAARDALQVFDSKCNDDTPFPYHIIHIDTEPTTLKGIDSLTLHLETEELKATIGNAALFGPDVAHIVNELHEYLDKNDVTNGSRTLRALTQFNYQRHRVEIINKLRAGIDVLKSQRLTSIIPITVSSSGGGTGSALQILLNRDLAKPEFRAEVMMAIPESQLEASIAMFADPFSLARQNDKQQSDRIMANSYATRIEMQPLLKSKAVQYAFHLGYSNDTGTVLSTKEQMAAVFGGSLYHLLQAWSDIKPRLVDGTDCHSISAKYSGTDTIEFHQLRYEGDVQ